MEKYIGDIYLITNVSGDEYDYVLAKSDEVVFKISNNIYVLVDDISKLQFDLNIKEFIKNNRDNNMLLEKDGYIKQPFVGKLFIGNIRELKIKNLKNNTL